MGQDKMNIKAYYVENMKEYAGNMKEYVKNIKKYEGICRERI